MHKDMLFYINIIEDITVADYYEKYYTTAKYLLFVTF